MIKSLEKTLLGIGIGVVAISTVTFWIMGIGNLKWYVDNSSVSLYVLLGVLFGIAAGVLGLLVDRKTGAGILVGAIIAVVVFVTILDTGRANALFGVYASPIILGFLVGLYMPREWFAESAYIEGAEGSSE